MGKHKGPPKTVLVAPFTYSLEAKPGWSRDTGNLGNCITDSQQIFFDAGQTEQAERDTVLHELLHAIWQQTGLNKKYDSEAEEEAVWQLTPRIFALLADNPGLVAWLLFPDGHTKSDQVA